MATFTAPKTGKAAINGTASDDVLTGNDNGMVIFGGGSTAGNQTVVGDQYFVTKDVTINGGTGNDTFVFTKAVGGNVVLHGGVSTLDNSGNTALYSDPQGDGTFQDANGNAVSLTTQAASAQAQTDVRLNVVPT